MSSAAFGPHQSGLALAAAPAVTPSRHQCVQTAKSGRVLFGKEEGLLSAALTSQASLQARKVNEGSDYHGQLLRCQYYTVVVPQSWHRQSICQRSCFSDLSGMQGVAARSSREKPCPLQNHFFPLPKHVRSLFDRASHSVTIGVIDTELHGELYVAVPDVDVQTPRSS